MNDVDLSKLQDEVIASQDVVDQPEATIGNEGDWNVLYVTPCIALAIVKSLGYVLKHPHEFDLQTLNAAIQFFVNVRHT